jgi:head-tail adaptor
MTVRLSRLLVLEAPQSVADGAGGFVQSWAALGTVWAEVTPGAGREVTAAEGILATTPYRITLRAAPVGSTARPKPDQRLRDGARIFIILTVSERDAEARYLICTAREEVPA